MKTDDLIALLAKDTAPVPKAAVSSRVGMIAVLGAAVAFVAVALWLGIRPDLMEAMRGPTYWMKTLYTAGLGVAGFVLVERLSRPGASGRMGLVVAVLCALAIVGIAVIQLASTPPDGMQAVLMGSTWNMCPWRILVLAVPGLVGALWLMRRYAPTNAWAAGAGAGLLAGGVAATVYGLFCQETAAPFVAIWYSLGIGLSTLAGAIIGSRALRW